MAKYTVKTSMGYCGTDSEYDTVEIPEDSDPDTDETLNQAMADAHEAAVGMIDVWYEPCNDE